MAESSGALAYVGLGSNLEDPQSHVRSAMRELGELPQTLCLRSSALYRTAPIGPPGQPDYINAAVALRTRLEPYALLKALQEIEHRHGRRRDGERWGPRTLDLDLLLYAQLRLHEPDLILPHPRMAERAFVLLPLAEIAPPEQALTESLTLAQACAQVATQQVIRLN